MRLVGRICYGVAATMGLLSLGMEWQRRQKVRQTRGLFPQPPSNTGMLVAIWAAMVALMGKVLEDTSERQPLAAGGLDRRLRASLGSPSAYPPTPQRTNTLRSDFDLGDQYVEYRPNAQRPFAAVR